MMEDGSNTLTVKELRAIVNDIEDLLSEVYKTDTSISQKIDSILTGSDKEFINRIIGGELPQDPDLLSSKLTSLLHELKNLPRIRITVAFEPTSAFVREIKDFLDNLNKGDMSILEIVIDNEIIAGMKLEYKGLFRDFSVGSRVSSMLLETKL